MLTVWILLHEHPDMRSGLKAALRLNADRIVIVGDNVPVIRTTVPVETVPASTLPPPGAVFAKPRKSDEGLLRLAAGIEETPFEAQAHALMSAAIRKAKR